MTREALAARRRELRPHDLPRQAHDRRRDRRGARRAARADRAEATLPEATAAVTMFPQRLINVPIRRGWDWRGSDVVKRAERETVRALGDSGRVLLRPSGTEPVLRVMVEARDEQLADTHAQRSPRRSRGRRARRCSNDDPLAQADDRYSRAWRRSSVRVTSRPGSRKPRAYRRRALQACRRRSPDSRTRIRSSRRRCCARLPPTLAEPRFRASPRSQHLRRPSA